MSIVAMIVIISRERPRHRCCRHHCLRHCRHLQHESSMLLPSPRAPSASILRRSYRHCNPHPQGHRHHCRFHLRPSCLQRHLHLLQALLHDLFEVGR